MRQHKNLSEIDDLEDFFYEEEDKLNQEFRFSRDKIKHSSQTE